MHIAILTICLDDLNAGAAEPKDDHPADVDILIEQLVSLALLNSFRIVAVFHMSLYSWNPLDEEG